MGDATLKKEDNLLKSISSDNRKRLEFGRMLPKMSRRAGLSFPEESEFSN
jgi:hypothetical protein